MLANIKYKYIITKSFKLISKQNRFKLNKQDNNLIV